MADQPPLGQRDLIRLATKFSFDSGDSLFPVDVELTCRAGEGQHKPPHDTWCVRWKGWCLDDLGTWIYEPVPSSRDAAFLAATRWTRDEAIERAAKAAAFKRALVAMT